METAKLFQNGKSQAVRLPKEYRFNGNEVSIKKIGDVVLLFPAGDKWVRFLGIDPVSDDFSTVITEARQSDHQDSPRMVL